MESSPMWMTGVCLILALGALPRAVAAEPPASRTAWPTHDGRAAYAGESSVDSLAARFDAYNREVWDRTDRLYRAGAFGRPGSEQAREGARVHLQLRIRSGMDFIRDVARGAPVAFDESSLARPFGTKYENYGLYPIHFLRRAVIGDGRFQMEYGFPRVYAARPLLGGIPIASKVDTIAANPGQALQVMSVEYDTPGYGTMEVLYGSTVRGTVSCDTVAVGADSLEVLILDNLEGFYVRHWGTHRLQAIAIWRSITHGDRDPRHPRFGARAYFPSLRLHMPTILPDLGLGDLRRFDYPAPILTVDWFNRTVGHSPDWIRASNDGLFHPWSEAGSCPDMLKIRFPDR